MTERAILQGVTEYVVNCAWQIPLLAVGAWLLVKMVRPGVLVQHWVWLSVLVMAVMTPLRGLEERPVARPGAAFGKAADSMLSTSAGDWVMGPLLFERGVPEPADGMRGYETVTLPLRGHRLVLSLAATRWLVGIYGLSILLGGIRLMRGLLAARSLARRSRELLLEHRTQLVLGEACRRLDVAIPLMRESSETDGPVVVGALRPVMLLPLGFEHHAEEEVRAALLHELAHVRRRDYLVNLMCQIVALSIVWHPMASAIQHRIRRTREMLCDAIAAEAMSSEAE